MSVQTAVANHLQNALHSNESYNHTTERVKVNKHNVSVSIYYEADPHRYRIGGPYEVVIEWTGDVDEIQQASDEMMSVANDLFGDAVEHISTPNEGWGSPPHHKTTISQKLEENQVQQILNQTD